MAAREERPAGRGPGMSGDRQRTVAGTLATGEEGDRWGSHAHITNIIESSEQPETRRIMEKEFF